MGHSACQRMESGPAQRISISKSKGSTRHMALSYPPPPFASTTPTGGPSPRFGYATPPPPPPPPPCPPGPLSYQGSIAAGHTYGGAEGARKIFSFPLPK